MRPNVVHAVLVLAAPTSKQLEGAGIPLPYAREEFRECAQERRDVLSNVPVDDIPFIAPSVKSRPYCSDLSLVDEFLPKRCACRVVEGA